MLVTKTVILSYISQFHNLNLIHGDLSGTEAERTVLQLVEHLHVELQ